MDTLETKGKVRKILEQDGLFLVSIPGHDGYFKAPAELQAQVVDAYKSGSELTVTFDRNLNIVGLR